MKKTLACLLALVLCFGFAACKDSENQGDSEKNKVKHSIDVADYAKKGIIPEFQNIILGDDALAAKDVLFESAAGMTYDEYCQKILDDGGFLRDDIDMYSTFIQTVNASDGRQALVLASEEEHMAVQYMLSSDKTKIAAIAVPGDLTAFGFKGVTKEYVISVIDEKAKSFTPDSAFHFMPKAEDGSTGLYYQFGDYKLEFYFGEQADLIMTVLYDTNLW